MDVDAGLLPEPAGHPAGVASEFSSGTTVVVALLVTLFPIPGVRVVLGVVGVLVPPVARVDLVAEGPPRPTRTGATVALGSTSPDRR